MYTTGFVKSAIGTSLISLGVSVAVYSQINQDWPSHSVYVGLLAVVSGFLAYVVGDWFKKKQDEAVIDTVQNKTEAFVKKEAEEIARKIIEDEENRAQKAIKMRISNLERGVCQDVNELDDDDKAKYCKGNLGLRLNILEYPDATPANTIVGVAVMKANYGGHAPSIEFIDEYLKTLFEGGWLSLRKYKECLEYVRSHGFD